MPLTVDPDRASRLADDRLATRQLLRATVRSQARRGLLLCLLSCLSALGTLALPYTVGAAIDALLMHGGTAAAAAWTRSCVVLTLAMLVLDVVTGLITGITDARTALWLRSRLLGQVLDAGPRTTQRLTPGDLVARLVGNAATASTVPTAVAGTLAAVLVPLGSLVLLLWTDVWLGAVFLAGLPLLALLIRAFVRDTADSTDRYQRAQGEIAGYLVEALGGARTIAAAGTLPRETERILRPLAELSRQGHRMWQVQGRSSARVVALVPLLQLAIFAVGGLQLASGALTLGGLLAASRYTVLAAGLGTIVGSLNQLVRGRSATARLAALLTEPAPQYGIDPLPAGPGTLELRGVTAGGTALSGIDLTIPGGTALAIVGRSGEAQSLLAAVAGRLADPDSGQVLLDGVPLRALPRRTLRGAVAYAFARPTLMGGTIADAIGFGCDASDDDVHAAARAACADDFVRRLTEGYRTPPADAPMSGGELQRLGLARAFAQVRTGRALILDDATSSLDTATELRVSRALAGHTRRSGPALSAATRLIIAHRAGTAARADQVAWLDQGRIRAQGRHEDLWHRADYRALFATGDDGADLNG